ncbi:endocuticle structural glycoprotein SgAbd-8, partial [Asbolus verrucosus]
MFQLTLSVCLIGLAVGARLDSQYLPPFPGSYSGGTGYSGFGQAHVPILRFDNNNNGDGNYNYAYSTGNGISAQERGFLKNAGSQNEAQTAHGSFSYTAPNGQQISVTYTADENGFHPQGAHLPTPPPIPEAILRSLEQNRVSGFSGDDGQYRPQNNYGIVVVLALVSFAAAARLDSLYLPPSGASRSGGAFAPGGSSSGGAQVPILRLESNNNGDGSYSYAYETGNGISAQEKGQLKNPGSQNEAQSADGSFTYTAPDGQQISVSYTADENGFQPQGAHLPTPPPIPDAILKSIQQNKAEAAGGGYSVPAGVLPLQPSRGSGGSQ